MLRRHLHDDTIPAHCKEPLRLQLREPDMCGKYDGAVPQHTVEDTLNDVGLQAGVKRGKNVVKHIHIGAGVECTRQRDAHPLPRGKMHALVAHNRLVALGKCLEVLVEGARPRDSAVPTRVVGIIQYNVCAYRVVLQPWCFRAVDGAAKDVKSVGRRLEFVQTATFNPRGH
ncbi:hypothetical protein DQ04_02051100 [Trypanosoma grayi]|uniref:hypothetical protein n=1 Tax=Trypanosoma grayi TaxID=71804 RepID=UPI0004F48354|nr:hypothetical protein DQ04_02051100 [Trypanosoma grayi]KEG12045.1 hypothetical protein DQ04_02051100 [Trypanosoma grayi]